MAENPYTGVPIQQKIAAYEQVRSEREPQARRYPLVELRNPDETYWKVGIAAERSGGGIASQNTLSGEIVTLSKGPAIILLPRGILELSSEEKQGLINFFDDDTIDADTISHKPQVKDAIESVDSSGGQTFVFKTEINGRTYALKIFGAEADELACRAAAFDLASTTAKKSATPLTPVYAVVDIPAFFKSPYTAPARMVVMRWEEGRQLTTLPRANVESMYNHLRLHLADSMFELSSFHGDWTRAQNIIKTSSGNVLTDYL